MKTAKVELREPTLFGEVAAKTDNKAVAEAFARRLQEQAGFPYVAPPLAMRNSRSAVVYYLLFASHNKTAQKIMSDIFRKHAGATGRV